MLRQSCLHQPCWAEMPRNFVVISGCRILCLSTAGGSLRQFQQSKASRIKWMLTVRSRRVGRRVLDAAGFEDPWMNFFNEIWTWSWKCCRHISCYRSRPHRSLLVQKGTSLTSKNSFTDCSVCVEPAVNNHPTSIPAWFRQNLLWSNL